MKAYLVAGQHEGEDVVAQLLLREPPPIQLYGSPPPHHTMAWTMLGTVGVKAYLVAGQHEGEDVVTQLLLGEGRPRLDVARQQQHTEQVRTRRLICSSPTRRERDGLTTHSTQVQITSIALSIFTLKGDNCFYLLGV